MPKSKIIKEIANGTVDIEISLSRLFLLASDVGDEGLMQWADNELKGYPSDSILPEYRKSKSYIFRYSGMVGPLKVDNITLQPSMISKKNREIVSQIEVNSSVSAIKDYVSNPEEAKAKDVSWLAGDVFMTSDESIQATRIIQMLPSSMYQDILSGIKQKVLVELIKMENKYGNLDNLEIQSEEDPENIAFWNNVNEEIKRQTKELYIQCFYESAAERAVRTVETHLRQMFRKLKPDTTEPRNIGDIINALLLENGAFHYCDTTNPDGKNFCKGFVQLTQGFFTAYRNPHAHNIHDLSKREAFEIITLSSMIMEVLSQ